jgi:hypothetical protein
VTLTLQRLRPDSRAFSGGDNFGFVGRVVIEEHRFPRPELPCYNKVLNNLWNRNFFVMTRNLHGDFQILKSLYVAPLFNILIQYGIKGRVTEDHRAAASDRPA